MFDSLILFILCHFKARSLVWLAQTRTISQQAGTARFRYLEENTAHGAVGRTPVGCEVRIHPTWNQASQSHPAWEVASAWKTILGACSLNITRLDRTSVLAKMNKPGSLCSLGMVLFVYLFIYFFFTFSSHLNRRRILQNTVGWEMPALLWLFAICITAYFGYHNKVWSSTENVNFSDPFAKHRVIFPDTDLLSWKCPYLISIWSYTLGSKSKVLSDVWNK